MARSRRAGRQVSHLDGGPKRAPVSFRTLSPSGSSIGRNRSWVSSVRRDLLRSVPPGLMDLARVRRSRFQVDLRGRRPRITPIAVSIPRREALPLRQFRPLLPLAKPVLRKDTSVCAERRERKEVIFAAGVGGRRWNSRGGPVMKAARFTLKSFHSCRR